MGGNDRKSKGFRARFFNKKVLMIAALVVVAVGAGGGIWMVKASDRPSFCNSCHIMKPYYDSWQDSSLLAKKHADADVNCHDCHTPSISTQMEEGVKYITGNYQTPLEKREFPKQLCLDCHDDFAAIQAKTDFEESNPHDSHNGQQECNLCHSMHHESKVMCAQCHFFDWTLELDDSWAR